MKAKLDENMPQALAALLTAHGLDVHTTTEERLNGSDDARLLDAAGQEGRLFFTFDADFADIRRYPPATHSGVVVFRLRDQRWQALEPHALALVQSKLLETLPQSLAIVDEQRVRIRR